MLQGIPYWRALCCLDLQLNCRNFAASLDETGAMDGSSDLIRSLVRSDGQSPRTVLHDLINGTILSQLLGASFKRTRRTITKA